MKIREHLATLDPQCSFPPRALDLLQYLGLATDQAGDAKGALELQRRGLEVRELLTAEDPLNTDARLMLIESYRYVGDMLFKVGDYEQAKEHYLKQLALNEKMVAADPSNAQIKSNHAVALIRSEMSKLVLER